MFLATVITDRPAELQVDQWALRDGQPYRAFVLGVDDVTWGVWRDTEALVVDVQAFGLLIRVFGERKAMTLLVGLGELEDRQMLAWYAAGYSNGSARIDRLDPRSALMAILDRFRRGEGRSVAAVLTRA